MSFKRVHIIVLDSLGIGEAPDAGKFDDIGADTFGHIAEVCNPLKIPNLTRLGIGNIRTLKGVPPVEKPLAYYGKAKEISNGKDTMTGHWELMGLYIEKPFRVFPEGFPAELIERIEQKSGRKVIGNKVASGTAIIDELGAKHMETGAIIVYTSADSVLQIAAHEEVVPLEELYEICKYCREITLDEPYKVGRIIARPFLGKQGSFTRTANRHDYALKPLGPTVLNALKDAKFDVISIGKIADIYDGEGITRSIRTTSNQDGMAKFIDLLDESFSGLSFMNLVDFDAKYGHRRDPEGYGRAIEEFDAELSKVLDKLTEEDVLLITADHGNDPTYKGTDHTREYIPLLVYSPRFKESGNLDTRNTFADIGATVAANFAVKMPAYGTSFLKNLN
uniref:phosphopentomutase n=1 Tax=Massilibacillus massiliensis TaxID=1806837 RepID=UPI00227709D4|nr:phosphopentomutase [Massilibacillus massiliensis]